MTKIYLVRHGEVDNPGGVEYVRLPGFFLSKRGVKQVERIKEYFKDKNISKIYSSPLERTRQTSKIISEGELPIEYSKELLEANYKKWQGLKFDERDKDLVKEFYKDPIKVSTHLGESLEIIQKRVVAKIMRIAKKHKGENIICVFHADPILTARFYFEQKPFTHIKGTSVNHVSITTITFDDKLECKEVEYKEIIKADGFRR